MTLKQVQAFLAVAASGNFADAAQTMFLSQPALSLIIKAFEEELGGKLFLRSTRRVELTAEGEAFLPRARELLAHWHSTTEDLRLRMALKKGKIAVAAMPYFAATALPSLLKRFKRSYPDLQIEIHDVVAEKVVELVQAGSIELGITFEPTALNGLEFAPLYRDRFVAVLPADYQTSGNRISWRELLTSDFITLQHPSGIRSSIEAELAKEGIEFTVAYDCHQLATIGQLVANDFGVAVIPSLCSKQMNDLGLKCLPITEPVIEKSVGLLSRPKNLLSVAAQAMYELALKSYGSDWSPQD